MHGGGLSNLRDGANYRLGLKCKNIIHTNFQVSNKVCSSEGKYNNA